MRDSGCFDAFDVPVETESLGADELGDVVVEAVRDMGGCGWCESGSIRRNSHTIELSIGITPWQ